MTLEDLMAAALKWPDVAVRVKEALASDLVVANVYQRRLFEFLGGFLDEYGRLPKEGDWQTWLDGLGEQEGESVREALRDLRSRDLSGYTKEFVADNAGERLRTAAARTAISRLQRTSDETAAEALREAAESVEAVEPLSIGGLADLREVNRWLRPSRHEDKISTGIRSLDRRVGGGWGQELIMVLADTGIGKSIALCNFGTSAALRGHNVLHLTLELGQRQQALRYYRRMTETPKQRIRSDAGQVRAEARNWWRFAEGDIHLLYKDAWSLTPEQFRGLVQVEEKIHWSPDVVILDYLDLLKASDTVSRQRTYEQLGYASHFIRRLCEEHECAVLTATQARRPRGSREYIEHLSLSQMGDSYKKVRAADVVLGLVQTPEEQEIKQARIQGLKVRDNPQGWEIEAFFEKDRMLLADIHHPTSRRIAREIGVEIPEPEDEEDA